MVYQGLYRASRHAAGRAAGQVPGVVRQPFSWWLFPTSAASLGILGALWRPLPLPLPAWARAIALPIGASLYFAGLALMGWGRWHLGSMYNLSTSLGAQLYADHRLVTSGPFAWVRHPMYLGGVLAEVGAMLVYRTWTTLAIALDIPSLLRRAVREEEALSAEFGGQWAEYRQRVPYRILPGIW
jgi:protein-S-isoprenylcysteine O-methyltransferase Ste14